MKIPHWEELNVRVRYFVAFGQTEISIILNFEPQERMIYKGDEDRYFNEARKGSKTLYFARSMTENVSFICPRSRTLIECHV